MKLNQPYYLNVVLLKIFFKELRRFMKHFFTKCSKCHVRFSLHFFFYEISSVRLRTSFI